MQNTQLSNHRRLRSGLNCKLDLPAGEAGIRNWKFARGFTIIELLLVIGIFAIVATLATINLVKPQTQASVDSTTQTLTADLKQQQLKAMAGDSEGASSAQVHGIKFFSDRYILFRGSTYQVGESSNFEVKLETNITLTSINFPSAEVVFLRRSGEVLNYTAGSNNVTIQNTQSSEQKTITVNRYGAITIN